MGSDSWQQRVSRELKKPISTHTAGSSHDPAHTPELIPNYLQPISIQGNSEVCYYLDTEESRSLSTTPQEYSFEESFWLVPDFFDFVKYTYDPVTKKASITPPALRDNPSEVKFIFRKVLLSLKKTGSPGTRLTAKSAHPCDRGPGGPASTTISNNCMIPIMTEDDHFVVMRARDTARAYRTDVTGYKIKMNNYLIPTLSADMSMWWYRIPNHKDPSIPEWEDDAHALANAEEALSIWHQDYEAFTAALDIEAYKELESRFYIGVYQRSYFSDDLQMRFVNIARIGNDKSVPLALKVRDYDEIGFKPLKPNFAEKMLGG